MNPIVVPESFNYIGVFLTFRCQLNCDYCINKHRGVPSRRIEMSGDKWLAGLRRLKTKLPLTFQGGEPTLHRDFFYLVNNLKGYDKDVLTNLEIDADKFNHSTFIGTFQRDAKYASIRVSYHHGYSCWHTLTRRVLELQALGFSIGVWEIEHPAHPKAARERREKALALGIDYRLKEFLGMWKGKMYGTMKYEGAVGSGMERNCMCKPSELLIGPAGDMYRCHSDLYAGENSFHNLFDTWVEDLDKSRRCDKYGSCNACDIKIKNNRFQEAGHTSVEISKIKLP